MIRFTSGKRLLVFVIAITAMTTVVAVLEPAFLPLALAVALLLAALLKPLAGRDDGRKERTETTSLLRSTLESTTDGILVVSLTGRILSHNGRFLELWGLEPHVMASGHNATLAGILPQVVDRDCYLQRLRELYADPEAVTTDVVELLDGRVFERSTLPHRDGGEVVGRVWSFRDKTQQRQTAAALAESESRFRRMAANVPGVIFQFYLTREHSLRFTYLSQGCQTVLGIEPDSFPWKADSLLKCIHAEDFPQLKAAAIRSAQLMEPWNWEGRYTCTSGTTSWLRAAARPTLDAEGRLSWDGLLHDVTKEKAAVEALHRREEQLAEAQRLAHIGSWESDIDTGESCPSAEMWRIFGLEPDSGPWSYDRFIDTVHADDRPAIAATLAAAVAEGGPFEYDCRIVRPDLSERHISARGRVVMDADGNPMRILGTIQDVTERRRSEERFRQLFNHVADAFFLHDTEGRILAVNPIAYRSLGYTEAELMELRMNEFIDGFSQEDLSIAWKRFVPGAPVTLEAQHIRKDGSRYSAEVRSGLFDDGGEASLIISTARDITERKQSAAALEKRVRVEQALTKVSRILSAPSPDINMILGVLGEAIGADRAYLFRSRPEGAAIMMDSTHEWCAAGVPSVKDDLQGIDTARAPWWVEQLNSRDSLVIQTVDDLPPEAVLERELLLKHGVSSTAAVPVADTRNGLLGFLGCDHASWRGGWSEEDVRVLQTAGEMLVSHFARELAEREIKQRDAILEAASFMAERFLRATDWEGGIEQALGLVGAAAGVSRAYLFKTCPGEAGEILVRQQAEWVAEGVEPMMPQREFSKASLPSLGLGRWDELFRKGQPVQGVVSSMPEDEAACLAAQGIRSILQIPIFVGDQWWGSLGFDDCWREREWSTAEWEVLGTTGRMIAAAVQRARAEQALGESEERFRQMAENIREVFYLASVDTGEIIYLSPAYHDVWGRSHVEGVNDAAAFVDSIVPEDRQALLSHFDLCRARKGDRQTTLDYRIQRPDGTIRWIRNRTFQIYGPEGRPYRLAGVCSDITEQKQMEVELRSANRIEAIGHLAAGIAHEINTPIQYIGDNVRFLDESFADLKTVLEVYREMVAVASSGGLASERMAELETVVEQADVEYLLEESPRASAQALDGVQRVAEIVRAMKEFSHPGTGVKVAADLNQAIRSTTTVARNEWKYVAELVTELDPSIPMLMCLPGELNQALLNLVVNAAHAIADHKEATGELEPGLITISTSATDEMVEIRVSDSGAGIPEEIRQRIFDPFFTTKEVGRGTGQGLTFVHSIVVDKHGGTVTFETERGVGTTFIIRLPLGAPASSLSEAA